MTLKPNTELQGGKYRILNVLGQGGFGITYLAEQTMMDRKVCVKEFFLKEYCDRDEQTSQVSLGTTNNRSLMEKYQEKFLKEARLIARFDHPNVIRIYDVFSENNTAYYVMEYIEGENLNDMVKRRGAIPESEALGYIRAVASGLAYVHGKGVNHLDVKPGNIMIRKEDGRPVLIDFGMSKQYDEAGEQTSSTPIGISEGYAPLEQYNLGGVSSFSPQTDIYSLAATLYRLVTGQVPPKASDVMNEGLPEITSAVSSSTKNAIDKAMQSRKKDRPATIDEFVSLLTAEAQSASASTSESSKKTASKNGSHPDVIKMSSEETVLINNDATTIIKPQVLTASKNASHPDFVKTLSEETELINNDDTAIIKPQAPTASSHTVAEAKSKAETEAEKYAKWKASQEKNVSKDKKKPRWILPIAAGAFLIVLLVGLFYLLSNSRAGEKYKAQACQACEIGNYEQAAELFRKAYDETGDCDLLYNEAYSSLKSGDLVTAITSFNECKDLLCFNNGELFSNLADAYTQTGDVSLAISTLEEGYSFFPSCQGILIGLINAYVSEEDGAHNMILPELIEKAKKNEPKNASLYYVEGNFLLKEGRFNDAIDSYRECNNVDPTYFFGYIGEGIAYFNKAIELQEKATNELDDDKYLALSKEFDSTLKNCIYPFEKAFSTTTDKDIKKMIAEYLKNVYFRFREEGSYYQQGYDKYSQICE